MSELLPSAYPPIRATTTDATAKEIFRRPVPRGSALEVEVSIKAVRSGTFTTAWFRRVVRIQNDLAGAVTVVAQAAPVPDNNAVGYAVTAAAVGENLSVTVTGAAGHTVVWGITPTVVFL